MEMILTLFSLFLVAVLTFMYFKDSKTTKTNAELQKQELEKFKEELLKQSQTNELLIKQAQTDTKVENLSENLRTILMQISDLSKTNVKTDTIVTDISSKIASMNDIMVNKKSRGNWGEYQLNSLLSLYAGDNREVFQPQYALKNGFIGDAALFLPETKKVMIIDSKFPMENYQNLIKAENDFEKQRYEKLFITNVKKHINDISTKYIASETTEQAVMFIPSEAIFMYICAECSDLIDYGQTRKVLLTSPTTLIGVVFTLVNITKDFNRAKNIKKIEKHIISLHSDETRLIERLEKTETTLNSASKNLKDVKTSAEKISSTIKKVNDGYIEEEITE